MRKFLLIIITALFLCTLLTTLIGCKAKSHAVGSVTMDTAMTATDSMSGRVETKDTSTASERRDINITIEFVTDGGTLSVDTGKLSIDGIKSVRIADAKDTKRAKVTATVADVSKSSASSQSATVSRKDEQESPIGETSTTFVTRWYDKVFAFIGCLCCIAALIWAIFLYLKSKL